MTNQQASVAAVAYKAFIDAVESNDAFCDFDDLPREIQLAWSAAALAAVRAMDKAPRGAA